MKKGYSTMKFYIGSGFQNCELVNHYAKELEKCGWTHTYNWTSDIHREVTKTELIKYAELERQAIFNSDIVIILLPAGRGTHIELGMALAQRKKIFLCTAEKEVFQMEHTVNFYLLPSITRLVGTVDDNVKAILLYGYKKA